MTEALFARILFVGVVAVAVVLPLMGQTPASSVAGDPPPAQMEPTVQTTSPQNPASGREAPGAIYKDAMRPLEVVRASLGNWSDAELGALAVGMHLQTGEGNLVFGAADLNLLHIEGAAQIHDGVKGAWERPGVDDVSFESDFFAE